MKTIKLIIQAIIAISLAISLNACGEYKGLILAVKKDAGSDSAEIFTFYGRECFDLNVLACGPASDAFLRIGPHSIISPKSEHTHDTQTIDWSSENMQLDFNSGMGHSFKFNIPTPYEFVHLEDFEITTSQDGRILIDLGYDSHKQDAFISSLPSIMQRSAKVKWYGRYIINEKRYISSNEYIGVIENYSLQIEENPTTSYKFPNNIGGSGTMTLCYSISTKSELDNSPINLSIYSCSKPIPFTL